MAEWKNWKSASQSWRNAKAGIFVFFIMPGKTRTQRSSPLRTVMASTFGASPSRFCQALFGNHSPEANTTAVPHPPGTGSPLGQPRVASRAFSMLHVVRVRHQDARDRERGAQVKLDEMSIAKKAPCSATGLLSTLTSMWKPKGMSSEEAIACLSLGDYFSSRRENAHCTDRCRTASSGRGSSMGGSSGTPARRWVVTPNGSEMQMPSSPAASPGHTGRRCR